MNRLKYSQMGLTWRELLGVIFLVAVASFVGLMILSLRSPRYIYRPSCQNNLKQFGLVFKMYSGETKGEIFPPLAPYVSVEPNGQASPLFATCNVSAVYPEYLTDMGISKCTIDMDTRQSWWDKKLRRAPEPDAFHALQDSARTAGDAESLAYYQTAELARSYVYLGYAVSVLPEFYGWLGATALLPVVGSGQVEGIGKVAIKDSSDDLMVEPASWPAWVPLPDREAGMKALDSPHDLTSLPTVYRLREGIERMFIKDSRDPASSARMQSTFPVMWDAFGSSTPGGAVDRFNHEPAGSNVLFLDGHVSYVRYPGKFPVMADRLMTDYFGQQGQG